MTPHTIHSTEEPITAHAAHWGSARARDFHLLHTPRIAPMRWFATFLHGRCGNVATLLRRHPGIPVHYRYLYNPGLRSSPVVVVWKRRAKRTPATTEATGQRPPVRVDRRPHQMDWIKFDVYFAFYGFQSAARFWLEWIPGPGPAGAAVVRSRFSFRGAAVSFRRCVRARVITVC